MFKSIFTKTEIITFRKLGKDWRFKGFQNNMLYIQFEISNTCDIGNVKSKLNFSTDDEDTCFNIRNVYNTADRDWTQVVDSENDVLGPEDCLKFTLQYNPGPMNCIDRNSANHEYFLHLLGEEFLQDINETNRYGDAETNMRGKNIGKAP